MLVIFILFSDIQSNLIDSRIERHQATYIPVSNPLLKNSLTRAQTPTAAPRPVSSILKRFLHERTATAPDEQNTTTHTKSITNLRFKRDLSPTITTTTITTMTTNVGDDRNRTTESTPSTLQSIVNELNETVRHNDTNDDLKGSESKEATSKNPRFHVTYWMFYPYSQVLIE